MNFDTLVEDVLKAVGSKVQASITAKTTIPVIFEESQPDSIEDEVLEVRIDGPTIDEIAHKQYRITVAVDLLLTTPIYDDVYTRAKLLSICAEALREDIPIIDSTTLEQIGCLSTAIPFGGTEKIHTVNYGKVHKDRRVLHSAVSTTFHALI